MGPARKSENKKVSEMYVISDEALELSSLRVFMRRTIGSRGEEEIFHVNGS